MLVCVFKNDLHKNTNLHTQTLDQFHVLCKGCCRQKYRATQETIRIGKRYGATNIPMLKVLGIDFISGDEHFNKNDVNALVGTYWYDPVEFINQIIKIDFSHLN
jgi:hypothetical protein